MNAAPHAARPIDVLIVGAGPTGLLLAGELRRFGVAARLVEKLAAPSPLSRAIAVHARTLEVLEELGVAEPLLQAGVRYRRARLFAGGPDPIVEASFDELDTAYPFALGVPQDVTERLLTELLAARGGSVERGVELTELTQDERGCRATLSSGEVVECGWVVGCDGAHSKVRKALGLTFAGDTNPERFWLADVKAAWDLPRDAITSFFGPDGVLACFPLPDERWRLIFSLGVVTDGEPRDPTLAEVEGLATARSGRAAGLTDPALPPWEQEIGHAALAALARLDPARARSFLERSEANAEARASVDRAARQGCAATTISGAAGDTL